MADQGKINKKLKICFVLPSLAAGGAERVLITLMNALDRELFDPALIVVNGAGPLGEIVDSDIPVYKLDRRFYFCMPRLYLTLKRLQPDIAVSTMTHMNFMLLLLKPLFRRARFIVREATLPSFTLAAHRRKAPLIKAAYRLLYLKADTIISPARLIIDELGNLLPSTEFHQTLLYNPVDLKRVLQSSEQKFEVTPERRKILNFAAAGRLHYEKGFDRLIDTLPAFRSEHDWQLSIWGEGGQRGQLESMIAAKGFSGKVVLQGHSNNPWPHFAQADCLLMPSRCEGLPNVVLEALACGTPVIATSESGGIQEIADLAPEGAVTVVSNMDEFLQAMAKVKPAPSESFRPSLLPPEFKWERVTAKFSELLINPQNK